MYHTLQAHASHTKFESILQSLNLGVPIENLKVSLISVFNLNIAEFQNSENEWFYLRSELQNSLQIFKERPPTPPTQARTNTHREFGMAKEQV